MTQPTELPDALPADGGPTAAILIIGDEILSGRTREGNAWFLAGKLTEAGIRLREIRVVPDDQTAIVTALNALRAGHDHLFTSGGIGPTHDDITSDAVAAAFGVPLAIRADAHALLAAHYRSRGLEFNSARQRMARIPEGARLIDNPVSVAPGFTLGNVHVMAGVPEVFQAMVASVLPQLTGGAPMLSQTLHLMRGEGEIAARLADFAASVPGVAVGSYPFVSNGVYGTNIVLRDISPQRLAHALAQLKAIFSCES